MFDTSFDVREPLSIAAFVLSVALNCVASYFLVRRVRHENDAARERKKLYADIDELQRWKIALQTELRVRKELRSERRFNESSD